MNRFIGLIALFAAALPSAAGAAETIYAFVNATVITMEDRARLRGATVVVTGDRITSVGRRGPLPAGAVRIDAAGKFLVPGFAEMHGHVPGANSDVRNREEVLFLFVARGITTVRGMQGSPVQFELRDRVRSGEIIGPNLYLAGPSFSGNSISSPAQAASRVRAQHQAGWDLLKIHEGLTLSEYRAIVETAKELGIRFGGHVPDDVGLVRALEAGQSTIDHLDGFLDLFDGTSRTLTAADLDIAARRLKAAGAWVVPTGLLFENFTAGPEPRVLASLPELRYVSKAQRQAWASRYTRIRNGAGAEREVGLRSAANRRLLLAGLQDRGAGILLGSDAPQLYSVPGFSALREMEYMARAGIEPYEVLRAGTVNPGIYFRDHDSFGMIREGMRADIVVLNSDPLADISNVHDQAGVMVAGRWFPIGLITARLAAIAARHGG